MSHSHWLRDATAGRRRGLSGLPPDLLSAIAEHLVQPVDALHTPACIARDLAALECSCSLFRCQPDDLAQACRKLSAAAQLTWISSKRALLRLLIARFCDRDAAVYGWKALASLCKPAPACPAFGGDWSQAGPRTEEFAMSELKALCWALNLSDKGAQRCHTVRKRAEPPPP